MSEKLVHDLTARLGAMIRELSVKNERRVYVEVAPDDLRQAVRVIFEEMGARYATATGMQVQDGFEVLHHFVFDSQRVVVSLRVSTESEEPEFDSITPLITGAEFIEREMRDLLGIQFKGHPNPKRLILSDDWPDDVYPLRRGRPWEGKVRKQV
ncbi:MAG: NADH-quinone oxidoreductase subunit C [Planctomycetes bacterium]|nr:NADH-quinone oxidoreductase subunit C [Planctomycetota bacterium]